MRTFVYIVTGNPGGRLDALLAAAYVSTSTLRTFHPDDAIVCLCDAHAAEAFAREASRFDRVHVRPVVCTDVTGGPITRSRRLKTSLPSRVDGCFVYLDVDTVVVDDLGDLFRCEGDLGMTLDAWFADAPGAFPEWVEPIYRQLGWIYPLPRYYNCGLMYVADTPRARALFEEWKRRYEQSVKVGVVADQPSFNSAASAIDVTIQEYPETYNFLCADRARPIPEGTKLVHAIKSVGSTVVPTYEAHLSGLQRGEILDPNVLITDLAIHAGQRARLAGPLLNLLRDAGDWLWRRLATYGLADASRR